MPPGQFMTYGDVAELLQVSETTVHRMVKDGTLEPIYLPRGGTRFHPDDVIKAVRSRSTKAPQGGNPK